MAERSPTAEAPPDLIEAVAKAIAEAADAGGCFDTIADYEALIPGPDRDDYHSAHGYPSNDYEDCENFRRQARAAHQVLAGQIAARALNDAADVLYSDEGPGNLRSTATWLRARASRLSQ